MIFEHTEVFNFKAALRGLRNPMNSWLKSDTTYDLNDYPTIGEKDLRLAQSLIIGGSEHRKFLRDIIVAVDITAPRYWWQEMSTYKVGTNFNSTSTMHKLMSRPVTIEDFEVGENADGLFKETLKDVISAINILIVIHNESDKTEKPKILRSVKQLLPESYLNKRTCNFNYEVLRNIYFQRRNHRLPEWSVDFCEWVRGLPYAAELITYRGDE